MVRKKVKLAFIENNHSRRITYRKRVRGLIKKTKELSLLCGVDVSTIVYGPYDKAPVIWPSSEAEAKRVISTFTRKPMVDQSERRLDQELHAKQSVSKAQEKLIKLQRRNREMEMENLISDIFSGEMRLNQVPPKYFEDLICVIDDKLRIIQNRIGNVSASHVACNPSNTNGGNPSDGNNNYQNDNVVLGPSPSFATLPAGSSQNNIQG